LYGAFVWARRALNGRKRRFPARAVAELTGVDLGLGTLFEDGAGLDRLLGADGELGPRVADRWLDAVLAAVPAGQGAPAAACNPSIVSLQDALLSVLDPSAMKAAAGDLGALLTELGAVPWKFEGLMEEMMEEMMEVRGQSDDRVRDRLNAILASYGSQLTQLAGQVRGARPAVGVIARTARSEARTARGAGYGADGPAARAASGRRA
jgi:hypothetical protein